MTELKQRGRPRLSESKSNAQRQKAHREKLKLKQSVVSASFLSEFGDLSDDEIRLIKTVIRDKRAPKTISLDGFYKKLVIELNLKNVNDSTLVDVETLYRFAAVGL